MSSNAIQAKAVVCRELNAPVSVETVSVGPPRAGEVTVRMAAVGVCHSDLSGINGTIAFPLPVVLGHEGAGVVEAVGAGVVGLEVGDHVISSFVNMCGRCRYCQGGKPHLCEQAAKSGFTLPDGSTRVTDAAGQSLSLFSGCGVMAEVSTLHADNLVKIDRAMPLDRAALIGCGVMTGVGAAVNTARVQPGSVAVVFGCGGVGLSAIQGCRIAGAAMIVGVDTQDQKLAWAQDMGATHVLNGARQDNIVKALRTLTGGGADYAFDCVGIGTLTAQAFGVLRRGGTAVVVGLAPPSDMVSLRMASFIFEEKTLTGSYYGSTRPRLDFPRLIALYRQRKLLLDELITRRYTIDQAQEAFDDLVAGRNARGVIVFDEVLRAAGGK